MKYVNFDIHIFLALAQKGSVLTEGDLFLPPVECLGRLRALVRGQTANVRSESRRPVPGRAIVLPVGIDWRKIRKAGPFYGTEFTRPIRDPV